LLVRFGDAGEEFIHGAFQPAGGYPNVDADLEMA
jgi:hypothetical protein